MFSKLKKSELKDIYLDYILSKEEGRRCESLVPYAEKYRKKWGELLSLRESIEIVKILFLEEVAKRYLGD